MHTVFYYYTSQWGGMHYTRGTNKHANFPGSGSVTAVIYRWHCVAIRLQLLPSPVGVLSVLKVRPSTIAAAVLQLSWFTRLWQALTVVILIVPVPQMTTASNSLIGIGRQNSRTVADTWMSCSVIPCWLPLTPSASKQPILHCGRESLKPSMVIANQLWWPWLRKSGKQLFQWKESANMGAYFTRKLQFSLQARA